MPPTLYPVDPFTARRGPSPRAGRSHRTSRSGLISRFQKDVMPAFQDVCGKAQEHRARSFLHKKFKSIGACSGYSIASLFLPGHPIPAPFFYGFSSLPAIDIRECFKFLFVVRLLHKLGDADRRLTRQNRLLGSRLRRAGGCPATPRKADDHGDDCPTNKAPHSKLNLPCSLWLQ